MAAAYQHFLECPSCGIGLPDAVRSCIECGHVFDRSEGDAPTCRRHPGALSQGNCERCGSFVCDLCAADSRGDGVLECSACSLTRLKDVRPRMLRLQRRTACAMLAFAPMPALVALFFAADRSYAVGLLIGIAAPLAVFAAFSLRRGADYSFMLGMIATLVAVFVTVAIAIAWTPLAFLTLVTPLYAHRQFRAWSRLERDVLWLYNSESVQRMLLEDEEQRSKAA